MKLVDRVMFTRRSVVLFIVILNISRANLSQDTFVAIIPTYLTLLTRVKKQ